MNMEVTPDVTLSVGGRKVKVKRAVLMENSKYFQALFTGQYADSKKEELDLTKDVNNIKDLKLLLQFMKKDDTEITSLHVNKLIQLSTFFMVDKLIEKCEKFMEDTLNISNCLGYYFLAKEHGLKKIEAVTRLLMKHRVHDLLIYEDEITQLKADEVQHLIEKDYLRFCTKESVCDFLLKWLDNIDVPDETHLDVLSATVEFFDKMENVQKCPVEDDGSNALKNLEDILKKHVELGEEMKGKFQNAFLGLTAEEKKSDAAGKESDCPEENVFLTLTAEEKKSDAAGKESDCPEENVFLGLTAEEKKSNAAGKESDCPEEKVFLGLTAEEKKSNAAGKESDSPEEKLMAVFTFSNRKHVKRDFGQRQTRSSSKQNYFDFCVYDPNTKLWYVIETCDMDTYYSRINYNKGRFRLRRTDIPPHIYCTLKVAGDYILLQDLKFDLSKMVMYNMRSGEWSTERIPDLIDRYLEPGTEILDKLMVYWNDSTFIILKVYSTEDESFGFQVSGMRFHCFQICPLANGNLQLLQIFRTDLIPCNLGFFPNWTLGTTVGTSSVSNEMLILDNTLSDLDIAYVVDLTPFKDGTAVGHLLEAKCILDIEHDQFEIDSVFEHLTVEILEKEDRFLIFCSNGGGEVQVKFEYIYQSQRLDTVENGLTVQLATERTENGSQYWKKSSRCDFNGSNWIILETDEYSSSCKEVTVQQSGGNTLVETHTPPPFMNVISVSAKKVHKDFFTKLTPVKHFLEPPVNQSTGKEKAKSRTSSVFDDFEGL